MNRLLTMGSLMAAAMMAGAAALVEDTIEDDRPAARGRDAERADQPARRSPVDPPVIREARHVPAEKSSSLKRLLGAKGRR